jgi:NTP pyrophosphatase (non-canonical NTP hydrolase)
MIEGISPIVEVKVINQNNARETWKRNDTPQRVEQLIVEESEELKQAVELAMIGASAFELASELGDVFYLLIKRTFLSDEPIPLSVQMAINYAKKIAKLTEIDLNKAVLMKVLRNDMKYPASLSDGKIPYKESQDISKEQWRAIGGDYKFSEMYLEHGGELTDMMINDTIDI